MKLNKIPIIISVVLLLVPPIFNPYLEIGYYTFLRLIVCVTASYVCFVAFKLNKNIWLWTIGLIALLFNPFIPVHLKEDTWRTIDFVVGIIFFVSIFTLEKTPKEFLAGKFIDIVGVSSAVILVVIFILMKISESYFTGNELLNNVSCYFGYLTLIISALYFFYLFIEFLLWLSKKRVFNVKVILFFIFLVTLGFMFIFLRSSDSNTGHGVRLDTLVNSSSDNCNSFDLLSAIPLKNDGTPDIFTSDGKVQEKYKSLVEDNYLHRDSSGVSQQEVVEAMNKTWADNKKKCSGGLTKTN